jgi:hypothetical protein
MTRIEKDDPFAISQDPVAAKIPVDRELKISNFIVPPTGKTPQDAGVKRYKL